MKHQAHEFGRSCLDITGIRNCVFGNMEHLVYIMTWKMIDMTTFFLECLYRYFASLYNQPLAKRYKETAD